MVGGNSVNSQEDGARAGVVYQKMGWLGGSVHFNEVIDFNR